LRIICHTPSKTHRSESRLNHRENRARAFKERLSALPPPLSRFPQRSAGKGKVWWNPDYGHSCGRW
jgi:hypothetical protein